MNYSFRIVKYIIERYPPAATLTLAVFLFLSSASTTFLAQQKTITPFPGIWIIPIITIFFLFLHIRIFDEFKDYEHDKLYYPKRPVARGLVTLKELKALGLLIIFLEVVLNVFLGLQIFFLYLLMLGFSFLMLKEFFLGEKLRDKLFIYTLLHQLIAILIAIYSYKAVGTPNMLLTSPILISHMIFLFLTVLFLEMARKVRAPYEENQSHDTYTSYFGAITASFIHAGIAIAMGILFTRIISPFNLSVPIVLLLLASAILYATSLILFNLQKTFVLSRIVRTTSISFAFLLNSIIIYFSIKL